MFFNYPDDNAIEVHKIVSIQAMVAEMYLANHMVEQVSERVSMRSLSCT